MLSKNLPISIYKSDLAQALNLTLREVDKAIGLIDARARGILSAKIQGSVESNDGVATQPIHKVIGGDILSQELNNTMTSVFFDLQHLYIRLKRSRAMQQARDTVKHVSIDDVNANYQYLKAKIKELEAKVDYPIHDRTTYLNFASTANQYYGVDKTSIDRDTGRMDIPNKREINVGENARIEVTQVTGGTVTNDSSHPLAYAIDPDPHTYWSQSILNIDQLSATDLDIDDTTYYTQTGKYIRGAIVHLDIFLQKSVAMNQIKILPFCTYPLTIVDISYRETDDDSLTQIPIFDTRLAEPNKDYVTFQFDTLYAKQIRITVAQETYDEILYLLDHDDVIINRQNASLDSEDQILSDALDAARAALLDLDPTTARPNDIMNQAMIILGKAIEQLNPKAGRKLAKAGEQELNSTPDQLKGYIYNIGISDIQLLNISYTDSAIFKSNGIRSNNNIFRIQIETNEEHPVLYDEKSQAYRATSIDWSIEIGNGRSIPILPIDDVDSASDPVIFSERLAIISGSAPTRWNIDTTKFYQLRANGSIVNKFNLSTSNSKTLVTVKDFNPNLIYTMMYYPLIDTTHFDPTDILIEDYAQPIVVDDEIFNGTDKDGIIELEQFPFISGKIINDIANFWRPNIYNGIWRFRGEVGKILGCAAGDDTEQPAQIVQSQIDLGTYTYHYINGFKWGNIPSDDTFHVLYEPIIVDIGGDKAQNVTDYLLGTRPDFMDRKIGKGIYHYIQNGKQLIFDGVITEQIHVKYSALTLGIWLVAKLNCNKSFPRDVSPLVKEATVLTSGRI